MAYSDTVNAMLPIHYWTLEGNSNDTGTGTTLNGTDTNMEYGTDSVVLGVTNNASFNLDGSIAIATSADLDGMLVVNRTVSFWVTPTLDTLVFGLFQSGDTTQGLDITMAAGVIPAVGIVNGGVGENFYGQALRLNEPNHILVEYSSGAVKMYCNGDLVIDEVSTITTISTSSSGSRIGKNGTITVGSGTFTIYDLHAKMSHLAVWNSVLTTQQKSDLFTAGRQPITRTMSFVNLPLKTELRVFDIDNALAELGGVEFIDGVTGSDIDIDFTVDATLNVRIVLHNVEGMKEHFEADVALGRKDYTYDGALLLATDRNYSNSDWSQPIPISKLSNPYITGKAGQGEILTCNPGTYTGSGTLTYTYQWYRDGVLIPGETGTTYTILVGDLDLPLFCRETVDNVISNLVADTLPRTWLNVKLYAIYEEIVGSLIPSASWAKVNFASEITNINGTFSNSSGNYTLPTGDFLVIATMKYEDTSNGRVCPEGRITYTGAGTNAPIYGSGFSRDQNNFTSWVRSTAYIYNATAGDTVSFEHRSDTDLMSGGSVAQYCHIQIINMTPTALLMAKDSTDTTGYGGQVWKTIQWDSQLASVGSSIVKSGNTFTLAANKDYLISYGIAMSNYAGSTRTQRISKAVINGADIPQSFSYAYMRQSADEYGDIGNMFMYKTGGTSETLELFAQRGQALMDGSVVRNVDTSCVFILDVTGANYYSAYDSTGGQLVTPTSDVALNLVETEQVTSIDLTKDSSTQLTCNTDGYWIMGSSAFVTNTGQTGGTRMLRGMKFVVGGVDQRVGESGSYQRNDQSSSDTWDMAMGTVGVYFLKAADTVQFKSFDAGQDGNGNSSTVGNQCGFWALDINSI